MGCSNFWKLDKIDKIFISFVCIIVSISCILQCFAAEIETVQVLNVENIRFSNSITTIYENSSTGIGYFPIEAGYIYTVKNVLSSRFIGFSSSVPALGVTVSDVSQIQPNDEYSFNGGSSGYFYFNYYNYNPGVTVTRQKLGGLESSIDYLVSDVGPGSLWTVFETALPYTLVVVVVVLGFYFLRRSLKWLSRGDGRL